MVRSVGLPLVLFSHKPLLRFSFSAGDDAFTLTPFVLLLHLAANTKKIGGQQPGFDWWFNLTSKSVTFRRTLPLGLHQTPCKDPVQDKYNESRI